MCIPGIIRFLKQQIRVSACATLLAATLLAQGCTPRASERRPQATGSVQAQGWNDTARFLSGMKGRADGPFRALEETTSWKSYAAEFDTSWHQLQTEQVQPLDAFQKRELASIRPTGQYVFYPFSGPDVLYMTRFFPEGKVMVMAGLEPVGSLRVTQRYSARTLDRELAGWKKSVSSIFERSFFVTSEMDSEFRGRVADGLLPMILLLLERSEYTIDHVQYGQLTESGEFGPEEETDPPIRKHKAVQVHFHRGSETASRTLYYFSTDLGPAFEKNPAFSRFLDSLGTPDTLVKSASFLLHWRMCSALRRYILHNSNLILEDDTGVPYSYFQNSAWQVRLYGEYSAPIKPFKRLYQKDLAKAFQDPSQVRPLGFSLGYGYGHRPSSMILAIRTEAPLHTASKD
jgi:hypothetical protein